MTEKRFIFYEYDDGTETIEDTEENEYYHFSNELVSLLNKLSEENEQLKYINEQNNEELIDEEILTNMECLMLLIPFVIFFILLTGIIIAFLVQLGWVVI